MLKLILSNTGAKKACVFCVVFAVMLSLMGALSHYVSEVSESAAAVSIRPERIMPVIINGEPVQSLTDMPTHADITAFHGRNKLDLLEAMTEKQEKSVLNKTYIVSPPGGFVYSRYIPMSYDLQAFTYQKCVERGLEYELVLAIIWRESRFTPDAVNINTNGTQDSGIMQINDTNRSWLAERHGITDLMDPFQNIDAGTAMLGSLTYKYGQHGALLAYQFGETGMQRQVELGNTTNELVELVYQRRDYYRQIV